MVAASYRSRVTCRCIYVVTEISATVVVHQTRDREALLSNAQRATHRVYAPHTMCAHHTRL